MGVKTNIQWTDATWNPLRGCSRVSEGCRHCYAEAVAARFSDPGQPYHGLATRTPSGPRWTGKVNFVESALIKPLSWREPRRVFVNSMSDLFHESVPDEWIDRIFGVMAQASRHTFQVLTKRPERMLKWFVGVADKGLGYDGKARERGAKMFAGREYPWPLPNVWIGVSCEDQAAADARIPLLLQTPAAVRFISAEPLLGPIELRDALRQIDWVIVGGESGGGARPCSMAWVRNLQDQCRTARVACFIKQLGARPVGPCTPFCALGDHEMAFTDAKGGDWAEWPADLRERSYPVQG